jgi:nucleotide-binding universal stress UspA family protein
MTIRDILVPLGPGIDGDPQLDAAGRLALSLDARVHAIFARPDAVMADASMSDMLAAAGIDVEVLDRKTTSALDSPAAVLFDRWRVANAPVLATWHDRIGPVVDMTVEAGRLSDLIVIGRPNHHDSITENMFTAAIYSTGRPTVVVPDRLTADPLDHVMVAWNGSLEAARAVAGALPLLEAARRVSIFTVRENPREPDHLAALLAHLASHGIEAERVVPSCRSAEIGPRLLETAAGGGASMIVMGAYTHHRVREAFLGGVTLHVLEHAEIPLVMAH